MEIKHWCILSVRNQTISCFRTSMWPQYLIIFLILDAQLKLIRGDEFNINSLVGKLNISMYQQVYFYLLTQILTDTMNALCLVWESDITGVLLFLFSLSSCSFQLLQSRSHLPYSAHNSLEDTNRGDLTSDDSRRTNGTNVPLLPVNIPPTLAEPYEPEFDWWVVPTDSAAFSAARSKREDAVTASLWLHKCDASVQLHESEGEAKRWLSHV